MPDTNKPAKRKRMSATAKNTAAIADLGAKLDAVLQALTSQAPATPEPATGKRRKPKTAADRAALEADMHAEILPGRDNAGNPKPGSQPRTLRLTRSKTGHAVLSFHADGRKPMGKIKLALALSLWDNRAALSKIPGHWDVATKACNYARAAEFLAADEQLCRDYLSGKASL